MTQMRSVTVEQLNARSTGTMMQTLGIQFTKVGENFIEASMPVDERTKQPAGLLHGGASCVLAETLGSVGSALLLDMKEFIPVGLEINANHIRPVTSGKVIGRAEPIHIGRTTHIWDIRIQSEDGKLVCISRLTVAIVAKPKEKTP